MKNTNFKIFNMHILSVKMKNPHMIYKQYYIRYNIISILIELLLLLYCQ